MIESVVCVHSTVHLTEKEIKSASVNFPSMIHIHAMESNQIDQVVMYMNTDQPVHSQYK